MLGQIRDADGFFHTDLALGGLHRLGPGIGLGTQKVVAVFLALELAATTAGAILDVGDLFLAAGTGGLAAVAVSARTGKFHHAAIFLALLGGVVAGCRGHSGHGPASRTRRARSKTRSAGTAGAAGTAGTTGTGAVGRGRPALGSRRPLGIGHGNDAHLGRGGDRLGAAGRLFNRSLGFGWGRGFHGLGGRCRRGRFGCRGRDFGHGRGRRLRRCRGFGHGRFHGLLGLFRLGALDDAGRGSRAHDARAACAGSRGGGSGLLVGGLGKGLEILGLGLVLHLDGLVVLRPGRGRGDHGFAAGRRRFRRGLPGGCRGVGRGGGGGLAAADDDAGRNLGVDDLGAAGAALAHAGAQLGGFLVGQRGHLAFDLDTEFAQEMQHVLAGQGKLLGNVLHFNLVHLDPPLRRLGRPEYFKNFSAHAGLAQR